MSNTEMLALLVTATVMSLVAVMAFVADHFARKSDTEQAEADWAGEEIYWDLLATRLLAVLEILASFWYRAVYHPHRPKRQRTVWHGRSGSAVEWKKGRNPAPQTGRGSGSVRCNGGA